MRISTFCCTIRRTLLGGAKKRRRGGKHKSCALISENEIKADYGYFQHRVGRCLLVGCCKNHMRVETNATASHLDVLLQPKKK
jgi:hypothetical protein